MTYVANLYNSEPPITFLNPYLILKSMETYSVDDIPDREEESLSERRYVVTKNYHPKGRDWDYEVVFNPLGSSLVLESGYRSINDRSVFATESVPYAESIKRNDKDLIYVRDEKLVRNLGYPFFREQIFDPTSWPEQYSKIGEGSESLVYKTCFAGAVWHDS